MPTPWAPASGVLASSPQTSIRASSTCCLRYEDKRFRSHAGVDPVALVRAAGQALWNGRAVSGGSTLTMQVGAALGGWHHRALGGKAAPDAVALALERRLSKNEILTLYLTHAPYGGAAEGIRAATYSWFGKEPKRLTPAEAALLVALPQSPERRRPDRFPGVAKDARNRCWPGCSGKAS